jgi:aspartyl protease family protein
MIDALVNNAKVNFMLDTGASLVSLTLQDAIKSGVDVENLNYNMPSQTANGIAYSAPIMINEIRIGNITINNVSGSVSKNGLNKSLLGMSFLSKLKSYEVTKDTLTLKK